MVHELEQALRVFVDEENLAVFLVEKTLLGHVVEESDEPVEVAVEVEEADGMAVQAELGPGEDFAEFIEGPEAAGQSHEAIGPVGHDGFALMHGLHHDEFAQSAMAYLFL